MAALAVQALRVLVEALTEGHRQKAYAVSPRDQYIDEKEKAIHRLCWSSWSGSNRWAPTSGWPTRPSR